MARAPSSGGKSRLRAHLPEPRLAALRTALLADTLRTVTSCASVDPVVFFTPAESTAEIAKLSDPRLPLVPQAEGDLGARMGSAIEWLFVERGCQTAMLIGSDVPLLNHSAFADAHTALGGRDVVIGPAEDGGYYLIGMQHPHPSLFEAIAWGSATVLAETLDAARRGGIDVAMIGRLYDVDTIDDLRRLEQDLTSAPAGAAIAVRRWFAGA